MEENDQIWFENLRVQYGAMVYSFLYRLTENQHDAEDLTYIVFKKAWDSYGIEIANTKSWLFKIAHRSFIDFKRKQKITGSPEGLEDLESQAISPDNQVCDQEMRAKLNQAVSNLPESLKEVVLLHYFQDLTIRNCAEILLISRGTVHFRLIKALLKLRQAMNEKPGKWAVLLQSKPSEKLML